jgi:hypothetical protein
MCTLIEKVDETPEEARYAFIADVYGADPAREGRGVRAGTTRGALSLSRAKGRIDLVQPMPEDDDNSRFADAAAKVHKHWQAGEYPEKTSFVCG